MTIPKQLLEAKICNKNTCELQARIDKAIEYIENECLDDSYNYCEDLIGKNIFEVLDILKGSDKE